MLLAEDSPFFSISIGVVSRTIRTVSYFGLLFGLGAKNMQIKNMKVKTAVPMAATRGAVY